METNSKVAESNCSKMLLNLNLNNYNLFNYEFQSVNYNLNGFHLTQFLFLVLFYLDLLLQLKTFTNRWCCFWMILKRGRHMKRSNSGKYFHQRCSPWSEHFQSPDRAVWPLCLHPTTPRPPGAGTLLTPARPCHPPGMLTFGSNWRWKTNKWKIEAGLLCSVIHFAGIQSTQKRLY